MPLAIRIFSGRRGWSTWGVLLTWDTFPRYWHIGESMKRGIAHIEVRDSKTYQIFRSAKAWVAAGVRGAKLSVMPRVDAVRQIRWQLYINDPHCRWCGEGVSWEGCQMHEVIPRSNGGEISLENSIILCYDCHQGRKDSAHGNRKLQFGGKHEM